MGTYIKVLGAMKQSCLLQYCADAEIWRQITPNNLKIPIISQSVHFIGGAAFKSEKYIFAQTQIHFFVEGSEIGQAHFHFGEFLLTDPCPSSSYT